MNLRFILLIISALLVLFTADRCSEKAGDTVTAVSEVKDFERALEAGGIWTNLVHDLRAEEVWNRPKDGNDYSHLIRENRAVFKSLKKNSDGGFVLVVNFGAPVDGFFVWTPLEIPEIRFDAEKWNCQAYGVSPNVLQERLRNCVLVGEG